MEDVDLQVFIFMIMTMSISHVRNNCHNYNVDHHVVGIRRILIQINKKVFLIYITKVLIFALIVGRELYREQV